MKNRTYRYFTKEVLFPFGYGLSYSTFTYDSVKLNKVEILANESLMASVTIKNTGKYAGEEVVQLYISNPGSKRIHPLKSLKGFKRISLQPGESKVVSFGISTDLLSNYDEKSSAFLVDPGEYNILIGKSSRDAELQKAKLTIKQ
jgi:beta-glucosidase